MNHSERWQIRSIESVIIMTFDIEDNYTDFIDYLTEYEFNMCVKLLLSSSFISLILEKYNGFTSYANIYIKFNTTEVNITGPKLKICRVHFINTILFKCYENN